MSSTEQTQCVPLTLKAAHTLLSLSGRLGVLRRALRDTTAHLYHLTQRFDERLAHLGTVGLGALLLTSVHLPPSGRPATWRFKAHMQLSTCKVAGSSLERLKQWLVGPVGRPLPPGGRSAETGHALPRGPSTSLSEPRAVPRGVTAKEGALPRGGTAKGRVLGACGGTETRLMQ